MLRHVVAAKILAKLVCKDTVFARVFRKLIKFSMFEATEDNLICLIRGQPLRY